MNSKTLLIGGAVIVAVALIFVGRLAGGGVQAQNTQNSNSHGASAVLSTNQSEDSAPDFTLTSLSGEQIKLSDYRGEKPVVLDFFATWCPNCRRDMPKLSRMYEKYKDQVEVIGVNLREREDKVRSFADSLDISFPIVLDPLQQAARSYGVQYTNFHVLIDKEGNVVGTVPGDISESHILSLISSESL